MHKSWTGRKCPTKVSFPFLIIPISLNTGPLLCDSIYLDPDIFLFLRFFFFLLFLSFYYDRTCVDGKRSGWERGGRDQERFVSRDSDSGLPMHSICRHEAIDADISWVLSCSSKSSIFTFSMPVPDLCPIYWSSLFQIFTQKFITLQK